MDIFQKIIIHPRLKNAKISKNVGIDKKLLLISADILLNLLKSSEKPNDDNDDDSVFMKNDDLNKMICLFLRVRKYTDI